jgi:hypothetical protein
MLSSIYAHKMAIAANSPRKKSALLGYEPSVVYTRNTKPEHPAKKWLKSSPLEKHDSLLAGIPAALLHYKKPKKIASFCLVTPSPQDTSLFLAQGQHDLSTAVAIHVHRATSMKYVASSMDKAIASHLGFEFIDIDLATGLPDTTDNTNPKFKITPTITTAPTNAAAPPAAGDPADAAPEQVLTLIPVTCPIAYGKTAPVGNADDPALQPILQANDDIVYAWATAINHVLDTNQGKSLHLLAPDPANFLNYVPTAQKQFWKDHLRDSIWINPDVLTPDDDDFHINRHKTETEANQLLEQFIHEDAAAKAAFSYAPANPGGPPSDLTTAMTSAFNTLGDKVANSSTNSNDPSTKKFNLAAMRLLCIHLHTNDTDWILPPSLNPLFENMAKKGLGQGGTMLMNRSMDHFLNNLQDSKRDYTASNALAQTYNKPFWSHFACTAWLSKPIRHADELQDTSSWNPFNTSMQDPQNALHRSDVRSTMMEDKEELAGWAKEDRTKSSTVMTHNFNVNTYQAMVELLANTASFVMFMVCDKDLHKSTDLPYFAVRTETVLDSLCHHSGRSWRDLLDKEYPWAWFKMAIRLCNIFAMFADMALHPTTNTACQEDKCPDQADKKLRMIVAAFDKLEYDICESMDAGDPGKFGDSNPHPIWKATCKPQYEVWKRQRMAEFNIQPYQHQGHGRGNGPGNANGGRGGGRGRGNGGAPPNHPAGGYGQDIPSYPTGYPPAPPDARNAGPTRGILALKDPNRKIGVDNTVKVPVFPLNGVDKGLCVRFTTRMSGGCPFGKKCQFFHMTEQKWASQPAHKKAEVAALVKQVQNLVFADGFDPGSCTTYNCPAAPTPPTHQLTPDAAAAVTPPPNKKAKIAAQQAQKKAEQEAQG